MSTTDRRNFFKKLSGAALAAGSLLLPWGQAAAKQGTKAVALPLAKLPQLKKTGGSVVLKLRGAEWLLARTSADQMLVVSAICTHAQCQVHYEHDKHRIACKCHQSHFDLQGKPTGGPAKKPLKNIPARIDGERILLDME